MSALPSAVFHWSTPLVVPGPTPWPVADLYRVIDVTPLRVWLDAHGYADATIIRGGRIRVELPKLRQPDRGAQLEALAHLLRVAGLEVEDHRVLHVAGLWLDDVLAGARMPVEVCAELAGRANESLPPTYSATGPSRWSLNMLPLFLVILSDGATVITHGTNEVEALAGVLLSTGSLGDVIQLCAEMAPEIVERGRQGPGDAAILAVVAWWMEQHPEIAVRPKMHPALQPLADAGTALGAVITAQTARIAPLSTCTWGTPHLPSGGIDADCGTEILLTFAEPVDLGAWEEAAGIPVGRSGARPYGMRVASITLHEHQRLVEANGLYGDGIVVASVTAPLAAGYAGACGAREHRGAHYARRADGRIEFAVWG